MLPLVFQGYLPSFTILAVFYMIFYFVQNRRQLQALAPIQWLHFSVQTSLLSIFAAWILGFVGLMWSLLFFIPAMIVSGIFAFGRSKSSSNGCLMVVVLSVMIFVIMNSFMGGLDMRDWYTFQHECPIVKADDLPNRTEDAFVVNNAVVRHDLKGSHTWTSKDKEGKTTTHHAYYAPLVDEAWTKSDPIPAWVDVEHKEKWVGRVIRDSASDNEWIAVQNSKFLYTLKGVGDGEDTYRIVESDEELINAIQFAQYFQIPFVIIQVLMGLFMLFWFRNDGKKSEA